MWAPWLLLALVAQCSGSFSNAFGSYGGSDEHRADRELQGVIRNQSFHSDESYDSHMDEFASAKLSSKSAIIPENSSEDAQVDPLAITRHDALLDAAHLANSSKSSMSETFLRSNPQAHIRRSFFKASMRFLDLELINDERNVMVDEGVEFVRAQNVQGAALPRSPFKMERELPALESIIVRYNAEFATRGVPVPLYSATQQSMARDTTMDIVLGEKVDDDDQSVEMLRANLGRLLEYTYSAQPHHQQLIEEDAVKREAASLPESEPVSRLRRRVAQVYEKWSLMAERPPFASLLVLAVAEDMVREATNERGRINIASYTASIYDSVPQSQVNSYQSADLTNDSLTSQSIAAAAMEGENLSDEVRMPLTANEMRMLDAILRLYPPDLQHDAFLHIIALTSILGMRHYKLAQGGMQADALAGIIAVATGEAMPTGRSLAIAADNLFISDAVELAHFVYCWSIWINRNSGNALQEHPLALVRRRYSFMLPRMYVERLVAKQTTTFSAVWEQMFAIAVMDGLDSWQHHSLMSSIYRDVVDEATYVRSSHSDNKSRKLYGQHISELLLRLRDALRARRMIQAYEVLCAETGRNPNMPNISTRSDNSLVHRRGSREFTTAPATYDSPTSVLQRDIAAHEKRRGTLAELINTSRQSSIFRTSSRDIPGDDAGLARQLGDLTLANMASEAFVTRETTNNRLDAGTPILVNENVELVRGLSVSSSKKTHETTVLNTGSNENPALTDKKILLLERMYQYSFDTQIVMASLVPVLENLYSQNESAIMMPEEESQQVTQTVPIQSGVHEVELNVLVNACQDPFWVSRIRRFGALGLWELVDKHCLWKTGQSRSTRRDAINKPQIVDQVYAHATQLINNPDMTSFALFAEMMAFADEMKMQNWNTEIEIRDLLRYVNGVVMTGDSMRRLITENDIIRLSSSVLSFRGSAVPSKQAMLLVIACRYVAAAWEVHPGLDAVYTVLRSLSLSESYSEQLGRITRALGFALKSRGNSITAVYAVLDIASNNTQGFPRTGDFWAVHFSSHLPVSSALQAQIARFIQRKSGPNHGIRLATLMEIIVGLSTRSFDNHHSFAARLYGTMAIASLTSNLTESGKYYEDNEAIMQGMPESPMKYAVNHYALCVHLQALEYPLAVRSFVSEKRVERVESFIIAMRRIMLDDESDTQSHYSSTLNSVRHFADFVTTRASSLRSLLAGQMSRHTSGVSTGGAPLTTRVNSKTNNEVDIVDPVAGIHSAPVSPIPRKQGQTRNFSRSVLVTPIEGDNEELSLSNAGAMQRHLLSNTPNRDAQPQMDSVVNETIRPRQKPTKCLPRYCSIC